MHPGGRVSRLESEPDEVEALSTSLLAMATEGGVVNLLPNVCGSDRSAAVGVDMQRP